MFSDHPVSLRPGPQSLQPAPAPGPWLVFLAVVSTLPSPTENLQEGLTPRNAGVGMVGHSPHLPLSALTSLGPCPSWVPCTLHKGLPGQEGSPGRVERGGACFLLFLSGSFFLFHPGILQVRMGESRRHAQRGVSPTPFLHHFVIGVSLGA